MLKLVRQYSTFKGMTPNLVSDVKEFDMLWAPDDGAQITAAVLAAVQAAAEAGSQVFSSQYGFTDQSIADAMVAAGKANAKSIFLFDKTQEGGKYEHPIVEAMRSELAADQVMVGTSSDAHQILHTKAVAILREDGTGWSFSGSFNLSASAEEQFNIAYIIESRQIAEVIAGQIQRMFDWVQANEPQAAGAKGKVAAKAPEPEPKTVAEAVENLEETGGVPTEPAEPVEPVAAKPKAPAKSKAKK